MHFINYKRFSKMFVNFYGIPLISIQFHRFQWIFMLFMDLGPRVSESLWQLVATIRLGLYLLYAKIQDSRLQSCRTHEHQHVCPKLNCHDRCRENFPVQHALMTVGSFQVFTKNSDLGMPVTGQSRCFLQNNNFHLVLCMIYLSLGVSHGKPFIS